MTDPFLALSGLALTWIECLIFLIACAFAARPDATRDYFVGIRVQATMASDEAWRAGHRAALRQAQLACLFLLPPSAMVFAFFGRAPVLVTVIAWGFAATGLILIVLASASAARAARAVAADR
ncbi:MAG: SdpI family protein [Propionibacteriaceae bacterium]|nr:SdpI family protein [Propionibacteriaceae bacterium]